MTSPDPLKTSLNIFTDGGSRGNPGPAAAAFVIINSQNQVLKRGGLFLGQKTNNEAEYAGILAALEALPSLSLETSLAQTQLTFYSDSELIVNQVLGHYKIKAPGLKTLVLAVHQQIQALGLTPKFIAIPRELNHQADALVNQILDQTLNPNTV